MVFTYLARIAAWVMLVPSVLMLAIIMLGIMNADANPENIEALKTMFRVKETRSLGRLADLNAYVALGGLALGMLSELVIATIRRLRK